MRSQSRVESQALKKKQSSPSSKDANFRESDIGAENTGEQPQTGSPPIEQRPPAS
jgi:hypothetical protein